MRRRQFFLVLSGAAIWPFALEAQQSEPLRRLGILMAYRENDAEAQSYVSAHTCRCAGPPLCLGSLDHLIRLDK
jgi:hypothetical protein